MVTDAQLFFSRIWVSYDPLSIYIHKFLRILTSGAKSGARSSRDAESGARMANRFLKKRTTFPSRIMMIKFSEIYVNVCRQLQVNFATSKREKIL